MYYQSHVPYCPEHFTLIIVGSLHLESGETMIHFNKKKQTLEYHGNFLPMTKHAKRLITRYDRATLICLVVSDERCASAPVTAAICHNGAPVVRNQLHLRHTTGMVHTEELQSFKRLLALPVTKPH